VSSTLKGKKIILSLVEKIQSQKDDWWNLITDDERAEIEEGMQQADQGELKSTDEILLNMKNGFKSYLDKGNIHFYC
jgi:hypothetical protein